MNTFILNVSKRYTKIGEVLNVFTDSRKFVNNKLSSRFIYYMMLHSTVDNKLITSILDAITTYNKTIPNLTRILNESIERTKLESNFACNDSDVDVSLGYIDDKVGSDILIKSNIIFKVTESIFLVNDIRDCIFNSNNHFYEDVTDAMVSAIMCVLIGYAKAENTRNIVKRLYKSHSFGLNEEVCLGSSELNRFVESVPKVSRDTIHNLVYSTVTCMNKLPVKSFIDGQLLDSFFNSLNRHSVIDDSVMGYILNSLVSSYDRNIDTNIRLSTLYASMSSTIKVDDYILDDKSLFNTNVEQVITSYIGHTNSCRETGSTLFVIFNSYTSNLIGVKHKYDIGEITVDALRSILVSCTTHMIEKFYLMSDKYITKFNNLIQNVENNEGGGDLSIQDNIVNKHKLTPIDKLRVEVNNACKD